MSAVKRELVDFTKLSKANVYLRNELAGQLEKNPDGTFRFVYTGDWKKQKDFPIGFALPLSSEEHTSEDLFPFFDNLIPEGWLLKSVETQFRIDKKNRFALLLATGSETIGAIKVKAIGLDGKEIVAQLIYNQDATKEEEEELEISFKCINNRCPYCLNPMSESLLSKGASGHDKCIREMWGTKKKLKLRLLANDPLRTFLRTIRGASISGAQRKGLFKLEKDILSVTNFGSRYILKPKGEYELLPENEHLTMAIAKEIGFEVPPFVLFHHAKLGNVYAVKRFDILSSGEHLRLEDAGQILNFSVDDKYDGTYHELGKAINQYSDAKIPDLVEFWKRLIFCFLTANGDMHLKNWGLLERDSLRGVFRLSPCYDLLNTRLAIPDEEIDIGLWLYDGNRNVKRKHFMDFAKELGIQKFAEKEITKIDKWLSIINEFCDNSYLPDNKKEEYKRIVEQRYLILTTD